MKRFETDAIVLTTCDYGESDRLVTFHSAACGKLRGIAKGARRSKKRFANVFEPSSLVRVQCREKNSFTWIEGCTLTQAYLPMRSDIEKWAYAALFSEIVLGMVPEGEPLAASFFLHKETLQRLERDKDPQHVLLLALLRFQSLMGYMAALDECEICRRALKTSPKWFWHPARGKLICADHFYPDRSYIALDTGTLALIQYMRTIPLEKTWRLRMRQEMKAPLLGGLLDWFRYQTRREIQSVKVIEQILPSWGISSSIVGSAPVRHAPLQNECRYRTL